MRIVINTKLGSLYRIKKENQPFATWFDYFISLVDAVASQRQSDILNTVGYISHLLCNQQSKYSYDDHTTKTVINVKEYNIFNHTQFTKSFIAQQLFQLLYQLSLHYGTNMSHICYEVNTLLTEESAVVKWTTPQVTSDNTATITEPDMPDYNDATLNVNEHDKTTATKVSDVVITDTSVTNHETMSYVEQAQAMKQKLEQTKVETNPLLSDFL